MRNRRQAQEIEARHGSSCVVSRHEDFNLHIKIIFRPSLADQFGNFVCPTERFRRGSVLL
jgi:hypothetical protein